ncbi:MAG: ATP-binding cassette protein [Actinomycetia bacterium]|nr:ATP-binding cassette protein [Actinomycetes bacterium]
MALFGFEGVTVAGRDRPRLDHVDGTVPDAGITVLAGPSGAGKSTLLRCCNRLEAPESGIVRFRGDDVATLDPRQHRRRVGMVFQVPVTFPGTVLDNLQVADPAIGPDGGIELLTRVHLDPGLLGRDAGTLSGGEAQRMVLARCLATQPEVLLLDEPTSALDGHAVQRLEASAREVAAQGLPVLWVTHDLRQMRRLADHLVVVLDGRWAWDGPPDAAGAPDDVAAFLDQEASQ